MRWKTPTARSGSSRSTSHSWTFGVNRFKNYVFLRYRVQGTTTYMPWNIKEKVTLIEEHNRDYVILVLREVDELGKQVDHSHSIVIDTNSSHGKFDLKSLMTALEGSEMESLNDSFVKFGYVSWQNTSVKSIASRLRVIFQTLDRYTLANVGPKPGIGRANSTGKRKERETRNPPSSVGVASGWTTPRPGEARSEP